MDYSKYDRIRPLLPAEVPTAIAELLQNSAIRQSYETLGLPLPWEALPELLRDCQTVADFKKLMGAKLVRHVMKHTCSSVAPLGGLEHTTSDGAYTYISNHRDIILDSAFLNVLLYEAGAQFPEIAIGDNLLVAPWVEKLVRLNGNFLVRRNLEGREVLLAAKELSGYINDVVRSGTSVWIAQREGRAKDANDRTQPALLKMLSLASPERGIVEALRGLNIMPLTCSYEFDPCDYLKAREMQLKRDMPDYKKSKDEDALNMKTGVLGHKGRVTFTLGRPLGRLLEAQDWSGLPEASRAERVAELLDLEIHRHYTLYPINYIAWDKLMGNREHEEHYTPQELKEAEEYFSAQLSKIVLPEGYTPDRDFLMHCLLTMYANPAINHARALSL